MTTKPLTKFIKPESVIACPVDWELYLFYKDDETTNQVFEYLTKEWSKKWNDIKHNLRFHLGYLKPAIQDYIFLGKSYKTIILWYDGDEYTLKDTLKKLKSK